jgi:hypothetical protein
LLQAAQSIMTKLDTNSLFQKLWVSEISLASKFKLTTCYQSCNRLYFFWC